MKNIFTKTTNCFKRMQTWSAIFLLVCVTQIGYAQNNKGIEFDGISGYANLGTFNPMGNFSDGLTIECWVKWDAFNTWSRIIDLSNGSGSDNIILGNEGASQQLRYEVYAYGFSEGISSPVIMNAGQWYHVAITHDLSEFVTIYIDGKAVQSGFVQLPANVGRYQSYAGLSPWGGDGLLAGKLDELRIWNLARSSSEIREFIWKPVPAGSSGLVAMYHFDEGSGSAIQNSSTNPGADASGFLDFGSVFVTVPTQQAANAIAFDGVDDCININTQLNNNSSYTKEAWIFLNSNSMAPQNVISSNGSPFWIDGGILRAGNNGPIYEVSDGSPLPTFTWVHVAVSYDAVTSEMNLFRNGALVATTSSIALYQADVNFIGAWFDGAINVSHLNGIVDEVRIWSEARSAGQILANMNRELDPSGEPTLVAYYNFNQGIAAGDNTGMFTVFDATGNSNGTIMGLSFSGSSSNFVQQQSNLVILPVQFGVFTAKKIQQNVLLQWQTITEEQADFFSAEHSTDGITWNKLGEVPASGNSNEVRQYQFIHHAPSSGLHHYRIGQKNLDGKTSFTEVRSVILGKTNSAFAVQSNLVHHGKITVQVNNPVRLHLVNTAGAVVWKSQLQPGSQLLDAGHLTPGMYFLTDGITTERLIIQ
ncbi:MAG: LamG-like jellyroll fold domain-containing protein [Flavisolibacter sp.]